MTALRNTAALVFLLAGLVVWRVPVFACWENGAGMGVGYSAEDAGAACEADCGNNICEDATPGVYSGCGGGTYVYTDFGGNDVYASHGQCMCEPKGGQCY